MVSSRSFSLFLSFLWCKNDFDFSRIQTPTFLEYKASLLTTSVTNWAIFESSWQQNLLQKKPKLLATFWAISKNLNLM